MGERGHVMTISRNGQVSIPAATRSRWQARQVIVVDLGDKVVVRPLPEHPIEQLQGKYHGKYHGKGPTTQEIRRRSRSAETERERSR